jgi:type IV pilus assembly protein PilW
MRRGCRHVIGLTLVELLVALAIGSLLIIAGTRLFALGQTAYRTAESVATLEETARYALAALTYDIEHAGFWGLTNRASAIVGRRSAPGPTVLPVSNDCGDDWAIDLDLPLAATSNRYAWSCRPYRNQTMPGADTLTVRRAEIEPATTEDAGRVYVRTTRFGRGQLYIAPDAPADFDPSSTATHALVTRGYYVSPTSSLSAADNRVPSLRVKTLTRGANGPSVVDEEVYPGVEDLQVEFGIDSDAPGAAGFDEIDAYVAPESAALDGARVLTVRVWLLLRSLRRENGYTASPRREYADRVLPAGDDHYRRALLSTTVRARNAVSAQ